MSQPHIEIRIINNTHVVVVDKRIWGYLSQTMHGSRGASYEFMQSRYPAHPLAGGKRVNAAAVQGDALYRKAQGREPDTPFEDRLLARAKELIAAGLLRNIDDVAAEYVAEASERYHQQEVRTAEKKARFREHAEKCLAPLAWSNIGEDLGESVNETIDNIIEAMEWAQSQ